MTKIHMVDFMIALLDNKLQAKLGKYNGELDP